MKHRNGGQQLPEKGSQVSPCSWHPDSHTQSVLQNSPVPQAGSQHDCHSHWFVLVLQM
jgi:hypothetical protein